MFILSQSSVLDISYNNKKKHKKLKYGREATIRKTYIMYNVYKSVTSGRLCDNNEKFTYFSIEYKITYYYVTINHIKSISILILLIPC